MANVTRKILKNLKFTECTLSIYYTHNNIVIIMYKKIAFEYNILKVIVLIMTGCQNRIICCTFRTYENVCHYEGAGIVCDK